MAKARLFIPIVKVDAEQRLVYGRVTDETPDMAEEICDYDTSAPLFRAWSEKAVKATDGKSAGNLRVMHGLVAAGKLTELICDDASKAIDCVAKVVDDAEWEKVLEGVYTGFSLGGRYVGKKWKDEPTQKMRYTVDPIEVSLVDLPCNPSSTFSAFKADGSEETIAFKAGGGESAAAEEAEDEADEDKKPKDDADADDDAAADADADKSAEVPTAAADGWVPENNAVTAKAAELSAAAGRPAAWAEFIEPARKSLIDEHTAAGAGDESQAEQGTEGTGEADPTPEGDPADPAADKAAEPNLSALLAVEQVWRTADGRTFPGKTEAADHAADLVVKAKAKTSPLAAALARAEKAVAGEADPAEPATFDHAAAADVFETLTVLRAAWDEQVAEKSLYDVRSLASVVQELRWLTSSAFWERKEEGDASSVPDELFGHLAGLGGTLVEMAREEIAEMLAEFATHGIDVSTVIPSSDATITAAARGLDAVKADTALCEKAGARHSKSDLSKVQGVHDNAVALGAKCADAEAGKAAGATTTDETDGETPDVIRAERDSLKQQEGVAAKAIDDLTNKYSGLRAELDAIKALPRPGAPGAGASAGRVVGKGEDTGGVRTPAGAGGGTDDETVLMDLLKRHDMRSLAQMAIKAAQRTPASMHPGTER